MTFMFLHSHEMLEKVCCHAGETTRYCVIVCIECFPVAHNLRDEETNSLRNMTWISKSTKKKYWLDVATNLTREYSHKVFRGFIPVDVCQVHLSLSKDSSSVEVLTLAHITLIVFLTIHRASIIPTFVSFF